MCTDHMQTHGHSLGDLSTQGRVSSGVLELSLCRDPGSWAASYEARGRVSLSFAFLPFRTRSVDQLFAISLRTAPQVFSPCFWGQAPFCSRLSLALCLIYFGNAVKMVSFFSTENVFWFLLRRIRFCSSKLNKSNCFQSPNATALCPLSAVLVLFKDDTATSILQPEFWRVCPLPWLDKSDWKHGLAILHSSTFRHFLLDFKERYKKCMYLMCTTCVSRIDFVECLTSASQHLLCRWCGLPDFC